MDLRYYFLSVCYITLFLLGENTGQIICLQIAVSDLWIYVFNFNPKWKLTHGINHVPVTVPSASHMEIIQ